VRTFVIFFFRIHEVVGLPLPLLLPEVGHHDSLQLQLEPRRTSGQCSPSSAHAHTPPCGHLCSCVKCRCTRTTSCFFPGLSGMLMSKFKGIPGVAAASSYLRAAASSS